MLEVRLIGTFVIKCDGNPVTLSSRAARSLFAYLILAAGSFQRREKLAGMFWPEETDEKARAYLRNELWRIRKAIRYISNVEYLYADDLTITFDQSSAYWLDVAAIKNLGDAASTDQLISALCTYQGELLSGFYEDWIVLEREHLQSVYEQKMERLLILLEMEKRWHDILEWAERWIALGQGPETAYRALIVAYDALGDRVKMASTYERYVHALRALDLEPSEQTRALAFKRTSTLNIPIPLTSFIGREMEMKEVASLVSKFRLVTITGSGGVGKTRLAIQVVADVLELFPDGVWFLDLAPLTDAALMPNTLANLLGLRESGDTKLSVTDLLINYFRSRTALVIFDNCEHLIEACAQLVNSLLTSCEYLSILSTSREVLRISGEIPYRVPSLEILRPDIEFAVDEISTLESVKLFGERAAAVSTGFAINPQNGLIIAKICQQLDGIPLAIELAAARVNVMTVEQILKRLDDRFSLLTRGLRTALPRQQTLRATIDWSYDLLSEQERHLFKRLAVFMGGWTLEAAEEVCGGEGVPKSSVLDLLSQLVNKSLVLVENSNGEVRYPAGGSLRYRSLEIIRQFAREKLFESTEDARLRDRHLAFFLKRAEEGESYLTGSEQAAWMDYLDLELESLRLALEWAVSNARGEESLRICGALGWFWYIRCHFHEGEEWSKRALELRDGTSERAQARALRSAGWMYFAKDDFSTSTIFHQESLDFYYKLGDMKEVSTALQFLGILEFKKGNLMQARTLFEESLDISGRVNNKLAMPRSLVHLGYFSQMDGDYVSAWQFYEEGLAICRELQDDHLIWNLLMNMGNFAFVQKNSIQAREYYKEALEICLKLKNKRTAAETLLSCAEILCAENQYEQSAQLQGFAETLFNESESLTETHLTRIKKTADTLKLYLNEDSYKKEFNVGKSLQWEQAFNITLQQER